MLNGSNGHVKVSQAPLSYIFEYSFHLSLLPAYYYIT